jgi:hypothetical protein
LKKYLIIVAATIITVGAAALDTAEYREAVRNFEMAERSAVVVLSKKAMRDELANFDCNKFRLEIDKLADNEKSYRSCLINSLDQTQTVFGSLAFASEARNFLNDRKDDELTFKAVGALKRGRIALANLYGPYYKLADDVASGKKNSILLRLLDHHMSEKKSFIVLADKFDQVEINLVNPDLSKSQIKWRMAVIADANN